MALIFLEGFDANDGTLKWNGAPIGTIAGGRFGTGRFTQMSNTGFKKILPQQLAQTFIGCAYNNNNLGIASGFTVFGDNGVNAHLSVSMSVSTINLHAGFFGSIIASAPGSFCPNTWYYLEMWVVLATSGGRCQIRFDGTQVIDFTGNTMNGGTNTTVDAFGIASTSSFGTVNFDDIYVCDATGTTNNTFLGDVRVQTLSPTGAGSSTQLTPTGSVNNWSNVNDIPDSSATFNSSAVTGQRDTYTMADLTATTGTVFGLQDNIHAYKTDAGSGNIKAAIKSGATLVYDPVMSLPSSNAWSGAIRQTDPNTGLAWTPAGVNAVEFGAEVA